MERRDRESSECGGKELPFAGVFRPLWYRLTRFLQVTKLRSDGQGRVQALQRELSSSRATNVELEAQVGKLKDQTALLRGQVAEAKMRETFLQGQLAEVETRLAVLKGEQDAICSEALDLGAEECRNAISKEHPEWDLSFLKAEAPVDDVSADEGEDEYIDDSDVDPGAAPCPGGAVTPGESLQTISGGVRTLETGESSRASEGAAGDSGGAAPTARP